MILKKLGGSAYRLTQEWAPSTEKPKTPANTRSITFLQLGNDIQVIRGSLLLSKKEILKEILVK